MQVNMGSVDRALRAVVGLVLLVLPFLGGLALFESTLATVIAVVVGLVMLGTAATGVCPAYLPLGIKTCRS